MNLRTEIWNGHSIRFVEKAPGDWWAVAKDVSDALGYALTTNMTKRIEPSEKGIAKWNTLGGEQEMLIISEDGIYDAIWGSHKREAKAFRKWVKQILRQLRQSSGLEGFQISPPHWKTSPVLCSSGGKS